MRHNSLNLVSSTTDVPLRTSAKMFVMRYSCALIDTILSLRKGTQVDAVEEVLVSMLKKTEGNARNSIQATERQILALTYDLGRH